MTRKDLSRIKTILYRKPKDELSRLSRWGLRAYFRCSDWAREMEESVFELERPRSDPSKTPVEAWFLTGDRFWYQTAYCAWTLSEQSEREVVLNVIDDGTLTERQESELRRLFPVGTTRESETVSAQLETELPRGRFPVLRARCDDYVNIRKLVDVHLGSRGWKLVLDSDMLFFDHPTELIGWWDQVASDDPGTPLLLMRDCEESYGYSRNLMERLTGYEIPPLLNVGICGLKSESIDWDEVECWCRTLAESEGTSYYLEQALVAMMASRANHQVLPSPDYVTFPDDATIHAGRGVLQHYVADSKPGYFGTAWKVARGAASTSNGTALPS